MPSTLYLDSRDLIDVISESDPLSIDDLRASLQNYDTSLVYSFSNVIETARFGDDREVKKRLELLDSLPKTFILGLPPLIRIEFTQAWMAFLGEMRKTPVVLPFRPQWNQTLSHKRLPLLRYKSMVDVVTAVLADNPGIAKNTEQRRKYYMGEVGLDRKRSPAERRSWETFRNGVANILIKCEAGCLSLVDLEPFCRWLVKHGEACPAWRVFSKTQAAFTDNVNDGGQRGDPPDYSHVSAVPYVDSATLDNRMREYYSRAVKALQKEYPDVPCFTPRVFPNLKAWLDAQNLNPC